VGAFLEIAPLGYKGRKLEIAVLKGKKLCFLFRKGDSSSITTIFQGCNMQKLIASFAQQMRQTMGNRVMAC
jgi:hypothetical protein